MLTSPIYHLRVMEEYVLQQLVFHANRLLKFHQMNPTKTKREHN